jgi:hypothetical protein
MTHIDPYFEPRPDTITLHWWPGQQDRKARWTQGTVLHRVCNEFCEQYPVRPANLIECANERCKVGWFLEGSRRVDAIFCSKLCAGAQTQRNLNLRKRNAAK